MKDKEKANSGEHHFLINPLHSQYEEELDRIRTEGDLTLIKVQTERKKLVELETKLAEAHKQLRERKKAAKVGENPAETAKNKGLFAATVLSAPAGSKEAAKLQLPTIPQAEETNATKRPPTAAAVSAVASGRVLQTEERLKVAIAERNVEMQKLRHAIDETRRKRLDALAAEKEMMEEIQHDEEDVKAAQAKVAELKQQGVDLKNEIAATEQKFDMEKQAFRLERQRLLVEVEEIAKTEKQELQDQPVPVSHKYSMFHNNIVHRRKHARSCKWKKVNLEQKIVSFEQKKRVLDRIVEETNVKNLSEFIQKYNEQERAKADLFARIEVQTTANAALNDSITQFTDDIARLSGAEETDTTDDGEKPSAELQRLLDADEFHIKRWVKDADIFAKAVKYLRDPIYDIYKEFFPNDRNEDVFDSNATRESGMMRRIGAIEERIMQFIMAKILEETETSASSNDSDTLRRLRQYQGRREQRDSTNLPLSKLCGVEPPSTIKADNNAQRSKDRDVPEDEDDDDNDDPAKDVTVMHPDVYRQKLNANWASESGSGTSTATAITSSSSPRKNATTSFNL
ncbi:uncharacterized protein IUM83_01852 [Phytophthora cinnamomi]|uniref:uncharacterized protein n=1 Tax=Phytophthora cinnamomi TaxID=4785 RepID=UPI00355A606E|nr:hypothetical protein IUM83_01852 [Phytophthora cinnamomi]